MQCGAMVGSGKNKQNKKHTLEPILDASFGPIYPSEVAKLVIQVIQIEKKYT